MESLKILLIDDDPVLLKALEDILQEKDHTLTLASGGQSGVDIFRSTSISKAPFDVAVTDLSMPCVDDYLVAAAIKHPSPATAVILLTDCNQRGAASGDMSMNHRA
jgi:CheY-like chemotaxis protein